MIHALPDSPKIEKHLFDSYQPKNKSPRNSDNLENKRQSLNLESSSPKSVIPKSFTEMDINHKYLGPNSIMTTPTPGSPAYKQLGESSSNTTPGVTPTYESSPTECTFYQSNNLKSPHKSDHNVNNYENLLTTISITYKAPKSAVSSPVKSPYSNMYENVIPNPEKAFIPTSTASLPIQEASQPDMLDPNYSTAEERPKSLSALEDMTSSKDSTIKPNLSSGAVCNTSEQFSVGSMNDQKTISSNMSSGSNIQYTPSISSAPYHCIDNNSEHLSPTDMSLSEVIESSFDNLTTSQTSVSFPVSFSKNSFSPNVSPTQIYGSSQDLFTPLSPTDNKNASEDALSTDVLSLASEDWLTDRPTSVNLIEFSPLEPPPGVITSPSRFTNNEKRKSDETEPLDENAVYQQVKYFRRSVHEVNALLEIGTEKPITAQRDEEEEHIYEDVQTDSLGTEQNIVGESVSNNEVVKENTSNKKDTAEENYDSLEPSNVHIYENIQCGSLKDDEVHVYENVEIKKKTDKNDIENATESNTKVVEAEKTSDVDRDVEIQEETVNNVQNVSGSAVLEEVGVEKVEHSLPNKDSTNENNSHKLKKFYEKDSLPPCLRARNLKYQLKTRSLDEEQFEKEFGSHLNRRRISFDENASFNKTNSLPKMLNQPKCLPNADCKVESMHLAHSNENVSTSNLTDCEDQKKRERIERYKEERRKILQDKYR